MNTQTALPDTGGPLARMIAKSNARTTQRESEISRWDSAATPSGQTKSHQKKEQDPPNAPLS